MSSSSSYLAAAAVSSSVANSPAHSQSKLIGIDFLEKQQHESNALEKSAVEDRMFKCIQSIVSWIVFNHLLFTKAQQPMGTDNKDTDWCNHFVRSVYMSLAHKEFAPKSSKLAKPPTIINDAVAMSDDEQKESGGPASSTSAVTAAAAVAADAAEAKAKMEFEEKNAGFTHSYSSFINVHSQLHTNNLKDFLKGSAFVQTMITMRQMLYPLTDETNETNILERALYLKHLGMDTEKWGKITKMVIYKMNDDIDVLANEYQEIFKFDALGILGKLFAWSKLETSAFTFKDISCLFKELSSVLPSTLLDVMNKNSATAASSATNPRLQLPVSAFTATLHTPIKRKSLPTSPHSPSKSSAAGAKTNQKHGSSSMHVTTQTGIIQSR